MILPASPVPSSHPTISRAFFPSYIQGTFLDDSLQAHAAVLCYSAARKTKKKKYVARGRRCHEHIRTIGKKGNPNLTPIEKLLDAEYAALKGRKSTARSNYEAAIALAARRGLVSEQAMINERFADFMLDCWGDCNEAHYRFSCSIDLYQEWGAAVKVQQLEIKLTAIRKRYDLETSQRHTPVGSVDSNASA